MPLIIGHRGGRHLWPENSLYGFRKLLELPVDGVEFDVHLTKAGELLIIHDPTLDRTTDRSGPVADLPAGEHRKVVLKESDGEAIPTLDDARPEQAVLVGRLALAAAEYARREGFAEDGYRVVMNCREHAGQTVFHIHLHLLAGAPLGRFGTPG